MSLPATLHLSRSDYTEMPWANGRGTTIEILRKPAENAGFLWRFSMATVAEDGAFSLFPGIERNLTIIDGPGFDLIGETSFRAEPLRPIAFPGDTALTAQNVTGKAIDFNVMTQRHLPIPRVELVKNTAITALPGATLCLFALGQAQFGARHLARHDFLYNAPSARIMGAPVLAVHLFETAVRQ